MENPAGEKSELMVASVRRDTDTLTSALGHEEPSDFAVAAAASPLEAVTTVVGLGDRVGPTADIDTKEPPLFVKQRLPV
jgi:hypothetical protein